MGYWLRCCVGSTSFSSNCTCDQACGMLALGGYHVRSGSARSKSQTPSQVPFLPWARRSHRGGSQHRPSVAHSQIFTLQACLSQDRQGDEATHQGDLRAPRNSGPSVFIGKLLRDVLDEPGYVGLSPRSTSLGRLYRETMKNVAAMYICPATAYNSSCVACLVDQQSCFL